LAEHYCNFLAVTTPDTATAAADITIAIAIKDRS